MRQFRVHSGAERIGLILYCPAGVALFVKRLNALDEVVSGQPKLPDWTLRVVFGGVHRDRSAWDLFYKILTSPSKHSYYAGHTKATCLGEYIAGRLDW